MTRKMFDQLFDLSVSRCCQTSFPCGLWDFLIVFESRHSDLRVKWDMRTKQGGQLFEFTQERLSALFCAYGERRDNNARSAEIFDFVALHAQSGNKRSSSEFVGMSQLKKVIPKWF